MKKTYYKIIYISLILIALLFSGCALTYEQPKCHLMLQGKSCLSDHSCCNPQTYNHINCIDCNHNRLYNPNWNWWAWNQPTYTNYVIVKPNNKPNNKPTNRPTRPNNSNNKPNKHRK